MVIALIAADLYILYEKRATFQNVQISGQTLGVHREQSQLHHA